MLGVYTAHRWKHRSPLNLLLLSLIVRNRCPQTRGWIPSLSVVPNGSHYYYPWSRHEEKAGWRGTMPQREDIRNFITLIVGGPYTSIKSVKYRKEGDGIK